jgi:hypothetical protein
MKDTKNVNNLQDKNEKRKIWITRIFCAFLALMMIVGIAYSALAAL